MCLVLCQLADHVRAVSQQCHYSSSFDHFRWGFDLSSIERESSHKIHLNARTVFTTLWLLTWRKS